MVLAVLLSTRKPMQEGVLERGMNAASKAILVKGVHCIRVHLEEGLEVGWLHRRQVCGVDEEAVLEVSSSEGACLGNNLLLSVVALFCQWGRKWGMVSLCLLTEGFLYSVSCSIFGVRFPIMTGLEGIVPLLTDEALGMTDYEGFVLLLTDEALGMTDHEGFVPLLTDCEGFVLAEGYLPLLAEQDLSISFLLFCIYRPQPGLKHVILTHQPMSHVPGHSPSIGRGIVSYANNADLQGSLF
jgi:hypothetical protein